MGWAGVDPDLLRYPPLAEFIYAAARWPGAIAVSLATSAATTIGWVWVARRVGVAPRVVWEGLAILWLFTLWEVASLRAVRPSNSLPLGLRVSGDGVELWDRKRQYAFVPFQDVLSVSFRRPPLIAWPLFSSPETGEVMTITCRSSPGLFYVLPNLRQYPQFASSIVARARLPAGAERSTFYPVRPVALGAFLLMLVGIGAGSTLAGAYGVLPRLVCWIVGAAVIAGIAFTLWTVPTGVEVGSNRVVLHYLRGTVEIPADALQEVRPEGRWAWQGPSWHTIRYARRRVWVSRFYYDRYDELIRSLEELRTGKEEGAGGER